MSMMNIQNNETQKVVTMKDIAARMGVSYSTAYQAYYGKGKTANVETAQRIAKELGYDPEKSKMYYYKNSTKTNHGRRESICSIAKRFGVAMGTVRSALRYTGSTLASSDSTSQKIREYARTVGYEVADPKAPPVQKHYWWNGNFLTKQEEVQRMKELRADGFSNVEIARKTGRSYQTVRRAIGKQPEDMTYMNIAEGQHARAKRNAQRQVYVLTHEINQHNDLVQQVEKINASIVETEQNLMHLRREQAAITAKIAENVPRIRKLSAQTGVKMQELPLNLSDLAPTAVQ